jgi:histone-lysine N-methyltransferase SETMAR
MKMQGLTPATAEIHGLGFTVVDHPPYCPDLAPFNFHLFPKQKEELREYHFLSDDEVKTAVKMWFHQKEAEFQCDRLMKHYLNICGKCVDCRDEYVVK